MGVWMCGIRVKYLIVVNQLTRHTVTISKSEELKNVLSVLLERKYSCIQEPAKQEMVMLVSSVTSTGFHLHALPSSCHFICADHEPSYKARRQHCLLWLLRELSKVVE